MKKKEALRLIFGKNKPRGKLFCFSFLIALCLFSTHGMAQQKITMNLGKTTLGVVLEEIKKQTGKTVLFNDDRVDLKHEVTVNVKDNSLEGLLKSALEGSGMTYWLLDDNIVLVPKPKEAKKIQFVTISGVVTDKEGLPIPGVTVMAKGTSQGTSSRIDGTFQFNVENKDSLVICASFVGMKKKEILYTGQSHLKIVLEEDIEKLEEVVVTGYQILSRERSTGAFDVVKNDIISKSHASDLSTALQGTTAGLYGTENEDGSVDYIVRGMSSLYADTQPLVVVDGFPVSNGFKDINPNDVESVTVLKDAAAASIWGARAANGVIVVTTRQGKQEAFTVEVNAMINIGRKLDLSTALTTASSEDQVYYERLAMEKGWLMPTPDALSYLHSPTSLAKEYIYDYMNNLISEDEMNAGLELLARQNNRKQIKKYLLQQPVTQQYNVSISNSTKHARNYFSAMYENLKGSLIQNKTERWRVNFNTTSSVLKWLDFSAGINVHYSNADYSGPTLSEINSLSPYEMIVNEDGSYATQLMKNRKQLAKIGEGVLPYDDWSYNILREAKARDYSTETLNTRLQAGLMVKFFPGINFDTKFQYELNRTDNDLLDTEDSYFVRNTVNTYVSYDQASNTVNAQFIPKGAISRSSQDKIKNYTWRNQLNIDQEIGDTHQINAILGFEISQFKTKSCTDPYVYGLDTEKNIVTPLPFGGYSTNTNGQSVNITDITGNGVANLSGMLPIYTDLNERFVSVYGNISYTYDHRFSLTGSIRSDASNLITEKASYRWAPLWSIGGSWNIHREQFMHDTENWLDRLTVRLTYGFNGNVEKSTSPVTLVSSNPEPSTITNLPTTSVTNRGNPNLRWEKTSTINGGIDFAFFSNRLFGNFNWYSKLGRDLIGEVALASVLGTTSQKMNSAKMSNKGIEVVVGSAVAISPKINFSTNITYAYNKNEVKKLNHEVYNASFVTGGSFVAHYPAQSIWAIKYLGMDEGIAYVEGANGRKVSMDNPELIYSGNALEYLQYMGPAIDPHTLGWTLNFSGYGFNLSFLLLGKFGGYFRAPYFNDHIDSNGKYVANRFIREVIEGSDRVPSFQPADRAHNSYWGSTGGYTPILNTLVESSSSIKLKEISLEYNMPVRLVNKIGLKGMKLYGQVRDIGCIWTRNRYGYDPEWLPGTMKPSTSFKFGLNVVL